MGRPKILELSEETMLDLIYKEKLSIESIAKKFNVSYSVIYKHVKQYNISIKSETHQRLENSDGHLKIKSRKTEIINNKRIPGYVCECICGNIKWIRTSTLRNFKPISCGCVLKPNNKKIIKLIYEDISCHFWKSFETQAKERNIEVTVSPEYIWNVYLQQNRKCFYSGIPLNFTYKKRLTDSNISIDRLDSNKGYIEGNISLVYKAVNILKGAADYDAFIFLCSKIAENHKTTFGLDTEVKVDQFKLSIVVPDIQSDT